MNPNRKLKWDAVKDALVSLVWYADTSGDKALQDRVIKALNAFNNLQETEADDFHDIKNFPRYRIKNPSTRVVHAYTKGPKTTCDYVIPPNSIVYGDEKEITCLKCLKKLRN